MECFESLWPNGPKLIQNNSVFKISTDSILLADFAAARLATNICDLGCGCGIISILLADKFHNAQITAIDIQPNAVSLARRNGELNLLDNRFKVINDDLKNFRELFSSASFDLIVTNPPYFTITSGAVSEDTVLATSRSEMNCSFEDICSAAAYLIKFGGRFTFVHKPERLVQLFKVMTSFRIEPKRMRLVYHSYATPPTLVLIEGRKGGNPGLSIEPPLILTTNSGLPSDEYKRIYKLD